MQSPEAADTEAEQVEQAPPRDKQQGHYSRFLWLLTIFIPTLCSIMLCASQVGFRLSIVDSIDRSINPLGTADYGTWPRIAFAPVAVKLSTLIVEERAQTATVTTSSAGVQTTPPNSTATLLAQTASPVVVSPSPDTAVPAESATASESTPTVLTGTSVAVVPTATTPPVSATSTITETSTAVPLSSPTSTPQASQPPVALFAANPLSGPAALNVVFTNFSSGVITSYLWNFGNSQISSAISPTHVYSTPGTYLVTLTVTGPGGTSSSTQTINVTNAVVNSVDLQLTKSVSASTVLQNQTFSYTLNLSNNSTTVATGVQIVDTLPAQVTLLNAPDCTSNGNTVTCFIGTLNPATSVQRVLTVRANAIGNNVLNTATAFSSQADSNIGNNSASASVNIQAPPQADIAISKVVDISNPNPGDTITFTITATNNGPNNATNLRISDVLSSDLTFSSFNASQGSYNSTNGRWNIGTLNNGASATLQLIVSVNNGTGGQVITNAASVLALDQSDPNTSNNSGSVSISVQIPLLQADLSISKTVDISNPNPGDSVTFAITVINNGPDNTTGIVITDALPTGLTFSSATPNQGSYANDTWSVGSLNNGSSATLQLTVTINNDAAGQTITNTATISASDATDANAVNNVASISITVASVDVSITKAVDNLTPFMGGTITYTITATNNGPGNASDVRVSDVLPAGVTYVSNISTQGTYTSNTGVWEIGALNNGASVTLTIQAAVNAGTEGQMITNTAALLSSTPVDSITGNNNASVNMTVSTGAPTCPANGEPNIGPANGIFCNMPAGNLVIDLSSNPIITGPGYDFVYYERPLYGNPTIIHLDHMIIEVATNSGGPWIEVFNWGNGIIDTNTNIGAAGYGSSGEPTDQSIPMTNPPLYGTSPYITGIAIDVDARAGAGTYSWVRLRTSSPGTAIDALQPVSIPVAGADLAISKSVNNANPTPGSSVNFTVTLTNNGPGNASGINVSDILPAGLNFSSANPSQGNFNSGTGIWSISSLNNAASASLQITATVSGAVNQNMTNTASIVASSAPDPNMGNNTASVSLVVVAEASDVNLFNLNPSSAAINLNDTVDINMQIRTLGPQNATNVQIVFSLPNNLEIVSHSCPQLVLNAGIQTCTFGNFNVGNVTDVVFRIHGIAAGTADITFAASANEADPVSNNNSVTTNIAVAG